MCLDIVVLSCSLSVWEDGVEEGGCDADDAYACDAEADGVGVCCEGAVGECGVSSDEGFFVSVLEEFESCALCFVCV